MADEQDYGGVNGIRAGIGDWFRSKSPERKAYEKAVDARKDFMSEFHPKVVNRFDSMFKDQHFTAQYVPGISGKHSLVVIVQFTDSGFVCLEPCLRVPIVVLASKGFSVGDQRILITVAHVKGIDKRLVVGVLAVQPFFVHFSKAGRTLVGRGIWFIASSRCRSAGIRSS